MKKTFFFLFLTILVLGNSFAQDYTQYVDPFIGTGGPVSYTHLTLPTTPYV